MEPASRLMAISPQAAAAQEVRRQLLRMNGWILLLVPIVSL